MFTGIIEEIGIVKKIKKSNNGLRIHIECKDLLNDCNLGDSIAVNGVCLTVDKKEKNIFVADIMNESLKASNLKFLNTGYKVNLERAMSLNKRLGGHIVTGHVDKMAKLESINDDGLSIELKISYENKNYKKYLIKKGSITLNGVSLTVNNVNEGNFTVNIIPHTFNNTNLSNLSKGDFLNLEFDVLAKYIENLIDFSNNGNLKEDKKGIDKNFLLTNGFF
ncbi:MAG: riboflavin synthase [Peptostreptococcaceae bacterium]|nr:riboflavin synthase [Peptostreptococcaceae bacterium]